MSKYEFCHAYGKKIQELEKLRRFLEEITSIRDYFYSQSLHESIFEIDNPNLLF